jgi:two-component system, OmpR family, sensor kinase
MLRGSIPDPPQPRENMSDTAPHARDLFERFLQLPSGELDEVLSAAADLVAQALGADKVDAFTFDHERTSLVSIGTSHQPLSELQLRTGLNVLPLANGGRVVDIFTTGAPHLDGNVQGDERELRGIRETLKVHSQVGVRIEVAGEARGVLSVASQQPQRWDEQTLSFVQAVARWLGLVIHRNELVSQHEQRVRAEERSLAAEELVTVLAHDLRNILGPIHLRLASLRRRADAAGREEDVRDVQLAARSVARMEDLILDLLDVARLEHGLFELAREPVELVELVEDLANTLASASKPVVVRATAPVHATADRLRVQQCIENLLANALSHCPDGKSVTIVVARRGEPSMCVVEVIDQGQGIPPQLLPHIFERYVRERRSPRRTGLGLGLHLAKRIAEGHGGDLTVESPSGGGARFTLTLPSAD